MAELASAPASESFVHALAGETEGNPFFIEEVVRHIRDTSGALSEEITLEEAGVPDGVREVTARRLRRLTEPTRAVLLVASVIGREFDYDVLQAVVSQSGDELVEALEEGVEARVLREVGHVGRYGFTHALVRATLVRLASPSCGARGCTAASARRWCACAAATWTRIWRCWPTTSRRRRRSSGRTARSTSRSPPPAAPIGCWPGRRPRMHYRAALRARELAGAVDDHVRAELLLALGASEDRAGLEEDARETFQSAIRTARQLGDPVLLSRGALGVAGPWSALSRSDPGRVSLLEEALGGAPGRGLAAARAAARADVARALLRGRAGAAAVAVARRRCRSRQRIGDPRTLAICLDARHYALWLPENVEERLEVAAELRRVAAETGDPGARAAGRRLDDHRPDGARRHRGRRHPDRGGVQARRGAAPADLAVVDVAVPRGAGAAGRATSTRPSG